MLIAVVYVVNFNRQYTITDSDNVVVLDCRDLMHLYFIYLFLYFIFRFRKDDGRREMEDGAIVITGRG